MIETMGLTHIQLAVRDVPRAVVFYQTVFGMEVMPPGSGETIVFLRTPGASDTLTLTKMELNETPGAGGGMHHIGFRLKDTKQIDAAIEAVVAAGGALVERGEHAPGVGFAYVTDPDGYVIEF
jgi:catechol 2,3-dioxygenase-like lactoylglutathione lyase family enzyme